MSLRKNTLNKIKNNIKRARRLGTIDPKTKLEDLGEAIRKDVRMKERERIPNITREKMKKAQEKRDRKAYVLCNNYGMIIPPELLNNVTPTEGRDEGSKPEGSELILDHDELGNEVFDPNGIKNDSSK